MKVKSVAEAIQRYGAIDFASQHWDGQKFFLEMLEIPKDWFPNWKVMNTDMQVHHIAVNRDMKAPLFSALAAVHKQGLGHLLKTFDGSFNIRPVRGSSDKPSAHSWALAIDLNAKENPLGATSGGFYDVPYFVKCFTSCDLVWGGNFHDRKDPQHFSYAGWE